MAEKAPAFQLYVKDILADAECQAMSAEEFGVYCWLLFTAWNERCELPSDVDALARICRGKTTRFAKIWAAISSCFDPHPEDETKLTQRKLYDTLQAQIARSIERGESGKRGAAKRWQKPNDSSAIEQPLATDSIPSATPIAKEPTAPAPQAPRLPLGQEEAIKAREILAVVWPLVAPDVSRAMTKTAWGQRNMKHARDMVAAGVTIDRVLEAHASATKRLGAVVQSLKFVQDELARNVAPIRPQQQQRPRSGAEAGYKVLA